MVRKFKRLVGNKQRKPGKRETSKNKLAVHDLWFIKNWLKPGFATSSFLSYSCLIFLREKRKGKKNQFVIQ